MNRSNDSHPFIPPITCVRCGKELAPLEPDGGKDYGMVDGGVIGRIYAPFGSRNDGTIYQIGICDDCIDASGLKPIGDYMFAEHDIEIKHEAKRKDFEQTGTYTTGEG